MPKELLEELKKIRVAGQQLNISKMHDSGYKSKPDDVAKKMDKSKKRIGSTSRRAKPKVEE
jgi:ATP-dependent RNA helicase DeaD